MINQPLSLRKVRDFGERIGDTIQFIKFNWVKLLGLYAVFVIPFLLAGIILGANSIVDFMTTFSGGLNSMTGATGLKMMFAALMFMFSGASYTSVIYLYMDHYEKNNGIAPSIPEIFKRYPKAFLYNIGYSLLVVAMLIPVVIILALGMFGMKNQSSMLLLLIPFFFSFILFFFVFMLMVYPVNIISNGGFGSAIPATFNLLKGRWWFSIGYFMILFIIYYFFSMAISTMLNILFGLSAINMMDPEKVSGMGKSYAYIFGLTTLIQQVFYLVIFVGSGIHYYSIHEEKNGSGLEKKIDNIGEAGKRETGTEEY